MMMFLCFLLLLGLLSLWSLPPCQGSPLSSADSQQVQQIKALIRAQSASPSPQLGLLHLQLALTLQQQWYSKQIGGVGLSEALQAFDEALRLLEMHREVRKAVEVSFHRGVLLKIMGRGEQSIASYRNALKYELSNVDIASLFYNLGDSELMLGNLPAALQYYDKSFRLVPCKTERYYGYVMALKEQNSFSLRDWNQLLTKLLDIEIKCNQFYDRYQSGTAGGSGGSSLRSKETVGSGSNKTTVSPRKVLVSSLSLEDEELWDDNYLPSYLYSDVYLSLDEGGVFPTKKSDLFYAIYIVADKAKDYKTAWTYLVKANNAEKDHRGNKFDKEMTIQMKNSTTSVFNQDLIDMFPDISDKASRVPIFVMGMMRSGSTLIETMLDAHPLIWGMGEDSVFNGNLTFLRDSIVQATGSPKKLKEVVLDYGKSTVTGMKKMVKQTAGDSIAASPSAKKNTNKGKEFKKMKHIVDKMLFNYRNIGFIHAVYPESLIIHMVRDPLDTIFSCYRQKFDDTGLEWSLDIKDLVLQFVLYLEYVNHFRKLLPDRVIDIRYEELIEEPEEILQDIIVTKLGLPWNQQVLEFHSSQRVVLTNSQSQVRQKLYKHSVGGWRQYAVHLQPIIEEWRQYLPYLKRKKILPFADKMNWNMDENFPYDDPVATKHKSQTQTRSSKFTVRTDL